MIMSVKLTILFKEPFWVGIFELQEGDLYSVSKVTFGPEPKEPEVYDFILKNFSKIKFKCMELDEEKAYVKKRINPKRMQRQIKKEVENTGIGTKAQIAMQKQHEENKIESKNHSKEEKEKKEKKLFEMKQKKKKEKHKGH